METSQDKQAEKAIPIEIVSQMVSVCRGNKDEILERALTYRKEHAEEILFFRWIAEKGLLKAHGLLQETKSQNAKIEFEAQNIVEHSRQLKTILSKIPDLTEEIGRASPSLAVHMETYIYGIGNIQQKDQSEEKLKKWHDFLFLLEHHISIFEQIQNNIKSFKKRGRPNTVQMLTGFIGHIAQMYRFSTDKNFSTCEYGDELSITEGMLFAQEAMAVFKTPSKDSHEKYRNFFTSTSYTQENLHNACDYVIKKAGKVKEK